MGAADARIEVPVTLHVNEATLELLERRVESHVKARFFKSIGAPVGPAGVVAIVYTLFSYIPRPIATYLEKNPTFKSGLQKAAEEYLRDPRRGQLFVRQQVEATARDPIAAVVTEQVRTAVTAYFDSPSGRTLVQGQVAESVGRHFKTAGQATIQEQVVKYLAGEDVKRLIRGQIKRELEPRVAHLLEPVMKNSLRQVATAVDLETFLSLAQGNNVIEKSTVQDLERQLTSPHGVELRRGTQPIAMMKRIRRGNVYDPYILDHYLSTLTGVFGSRFQHVVITDADGAFLARIEPSRFRRALADAQQPLMRLLNARPETPSPDQARAELGRLFGAPVDAAIEPGLSIRDALRDRVWLRVASGEVAVLRDGRRFMGTTTRGRLLAAVLQALPG